MNVLAAVAVGLLALAVVLWFVLEYLPIGRYFYAIGANPKAAALNGIPVRRYTIAAFVCSGTLTAAAGIIAPSHIFLAFLLFGLAVGHLCAALFYHGMIRKDQILQRMVPGTNVTPEGVGRPSR